MEWKSLSDVEDIDCLRKEITTITDRTWPSFLTEGPLISQLVSQLIDMFADYQFILYDDKTVVAIVNCAPLNWHEDFSELPDNGLEWALSKSIKDKHQRLTCNLLAALSVTINPDYQGQGISNHCIDKLKEICEKQKLKKLIIPVRPNLKSLYPLIPMKNYLAWLRDDNLYYDSWLRVHQRLGGRVLNICSASMTVIASIEEWMEWTCLIFPESGNYIIKDALSPVYFDCEHQKGIYTEANVWVVYE